MQQHYELTYIVPMTFTVDELPVITKKVADLLKEHGGEIVKDESMGKLKFAYPINKLSHGYYQVVEFDMPGENLVEIDSTLKIAEDVLRYILVKKKVKSEDELAAEQRLRDKIAEQDQGRKSIFDEDDGEEEVSKPTKPKKAPVKTEKSEEEKVGIEDLDKKLDSILEGDDMLQ